MPKKTYIYDTKTMAMERADHETIQAYAHLHGITLKAALSRLLQLAIRP